MLFVMLLPLPSFILDLLLTVSIAASVLVLLTAIQVLRPVQFSVFPSLILLLTLMRLSLDLASTRRILLHGNEGTGAAGAVIEAFGQFVVGGPHGGGYRALYPGRDAGQADGHRCRPERRPDQRGASPSPA